MNEFFEEAMSTIHTGTALWSIRLAIWFGVAAIGVLLHSAASERIAVDARAAPDKDVQ